MKEKICGILFLMSFFLTGCTTNQTRSQVLPDERFARIQYEQTAVPNDITLIGGNTTVRAGENGSLTIKGQSGIRYTITANYMLTDKGLTTTANRAAGADGIVTLTWNVNPNTLPGTYPITISGGGRTIKTTYTVIKS